MNSEEKKQKANNTTEEIALSFVRRSAEAINKQLQAEIIRNGFSLDKVREGNLKLVRAVAVSEKDDRYIAESFSIKGRLIMAVKWNPAGFIIERNSETVANAVKVNPKFGIKKGAKASLIASATQKEIEIEAGAAEYMREFLKDKHLGKA